MKIDKIYVYAAYGIVTIHDDDRDWVCLRTRGGTRPAWLPNVLRCWSTKVPRWADQIPVEGVVGYIVNQLRGMEDRNVYDSSLSYYFPNGWDFWGSGWPAPLCPYRRDIRACVDEDHGSQAYC